MKKLFTIVLFISLCYTIKAQNNFTIQLNAGPLFITESEFANTGYNLSLSMLYHFSNCIDFSLRGGYLNWSSKEEVPLLYSLNTSSYSIPLLGGIRYYFLTQNIKPYVSMEVGISFVQTKISDEIYYAQTYKKITPKQKIGSWKGYSLGISAGLYLTIVENINLDINIVAQHPEVSFDYLQLSAGLGIGIF